MKSKNTGKQRQTIDVHILLFLKGSKKRRCDSEPKRLKKLSPSGRGPIERRPNTRMRQKREGVAERKKVAKKERQVQRYELMNAKV